MNPGRRILSELSWTVRNQVRDSLEGAIDRKLGIATAGPNYTEARDANADHVRYEPIRYRVLEHLTERLPLTQDDVVVDIGCGLGRAVCHFAQFRIKSSIGIEHDPPLADAARRNATALVGRQAPIEILTCDATVADYADATLIFMYNPFAAQILCAVLQRIVASLVQNPRRLAVAYANPVHAQEFDAFPQFRQIDAFRIPRLGIPGWAPVDLGGTSVRIWAADQSTFRAD